MKLDLTDLIATLLPDPPTLTINGRDYPLGHLTVGQVARLQAAAGSTNAELLDALDDAFGADAPPALALARANFAIENAATLGERTRLRHEVNLIYAGVLAVIVEGSSSKNLEAAVETMNTRIAAPTADSPPSAG